jgi:hypothetical protein
MQRYFMTIPEASQLVLQAGAMGSGGEIFILDMGEPVKIVDLARDLITLSGFRPDIDIEIKFAGVRPGEKLFEQLATDAEHADKTKHPKIFIGRIDAQAFPEVMRGIEALTALADSGDPVRIRAGLCGLVPEYSGGQADAAQLDTAAQVASAVSAVAQVAAAALPVRTPGLPPVLGTGPIPTSPGERQAVPVIDVTTREAAIPEATPAELSKPRRADGGTGSQTAIAVQS